MASGTQALGLAGEEFRVTGTDISSASVARAREEARSRGLAVDVAVADVRDLSRVLGRFDVVLSADNALPHLLDDEQMRDRPSSPFSTVRFLVCTEDGDGRWGIEHHGGRFHQPVLTATAP